MDAKTTFLNLKEARQEEIRLVALEEFSRYTYTEASLSRIVQSLGLAKGSFYRYFNGKKELYLYLLDYCFAFRLQNEKQILDGSIPDFFDMLEANIAARMRFGLAYPLHMAFMNRALEEKTDTELGNLSAMLEDKILTQIEAILKFPAYQNQFTSTVPNNVVVFSIYQMNRGIYQYLQKFPPANDEAVISVARSFIHVLKNGIKNI
ncbi:TetR/AcrR family transcriptional regulator [Cytophagales bacterium LB-30]|uniref:TetR/AcrR family transcriptional regulator n=1 Tax=Shiella aurantiaca TaxID=3058365 RepID=A0ABT8F8Q8_9BACT|nr:TetR/AcrR family transcriptional regulator [Shiella aurantiaca]MDN4166867.1 TetR/AcrR family transcriptional regulator [Shiella aurantiaca]